MRINIKKYCYTAIALVLVSSSLHQAISAENKNEDFNISSEKPVDIESDSLFYDRFKDIVYAQGDVYIQQEQQSIIADEVVYDRKSGDIYAKKNVAIKREDGSIFFAEEATINRNKNIGAATHFKGRMGKQGLISSNIAEMHDENTMTMKDVVYSPCNVCEENLFSFVPLWQFRATDAELDKQKEQIFYKNARIEAHGIPVFYSPYLITPSPNAKRKSGFLMPRFAKYGDTGQAIKLPFYFNLAPNYDATYSPTVISGDNLWMHQLELRHKNHIVDHSINLHALNYQKYDKSGATIKNKKETRKYLDYSGRYNLENSILRGSLDAEIKRLHDPSKTFLKRFKISDENVLKSDLHFHKFNIDHYYEARTLYFQDLRPNTSLKTTPIALPYISLHLEKPLEQHDIRVSSDFNYLSLQRSQGASYNRFNAYLGADQTKISNSGFVFKNNLSSRFDFYQTDFKKVEAKSNYTGKDNKNGLETRMYPEFHSEASYPMISNYGDYAFLIEPVAGVIVSPNVKKLQTINNEDSQDPEISASNAFLATKYKGYDLLDSGTRMSYGFRGNIKAPWFKNANYLFAQNYRVRQNTDFSKISGLDKRKSDYVARFGVQPITELYLSQNLRIEKSTGKILRNEVSSALSFIKFSATLMYSSIDKSLLTAEKRNNARKELVASSAYNFYGNFWAESAFTTKINGKNPGQKRRLISDKVGLVHSTECLKTSFRVSRDHTAINDLKPSVTYMFNIEVPTF